MSGMFGGGSIQLARILGIRIGVHPSWFVVLFLMIWTLSGLYADVVGGDQAFVLATLSALLFFASVVLHELGHAVVARRNGIETHGIDLWLLGGLARLSRDSDSPGVEFRVAAAGPAVTLVFGAVCLGLGALLSSGGFGDALGFEDDGSVGAGEAVLAWLTYVNAVLLVFNLIPGFPLDGGRIARAIAWKITGDRAKGTRFASILGQGFAYLLIGYGLWRFMLGDVTALIWFGIMGFFIIQAARAADVQSRITARIEGLRVADVMDAEPVSVSADTKLDRALDEYFLRYGYPWFPVVDAGGRFIGVISRERAERVPEQIRATSSVDEVAQFDLGNAHAVSLDAPLESLLASEGLRALGAIMAVDREGVLRGVVTIDQVRRALRPAEPVT
jgi:Zn-dependent protease/predicted transcriptional regulator